MLKKSVICIFDFGQSNIKINLFIFKNLSLIKTYVYKNNFLIKKKNKKTFYEFENLAEFIKNKVKFLSKIFYLKHISCVSHGSSCFYIEKKKVYGANHHNSNLKIKKLDNEFTKILKKNLNTFTPSMDCFHNMGKNYFYVSKLNDNIKFLNLPSIISWIFMNKNISDKTYFGCHSYLWDFKNNKFSYLSNKIGKRSFPKIYKTGKKIGSFRIKQKNKFLITKVYNGGHDTSLAFYFHNKFFKNSNSIYLSSGTYFVIGKYIERKHLPKKISKNYLLKSVENNKLIEVKRFSSKSLSNQNIIKKISKEFKFKNEKINLIIDGPFLQNKRLIKELKKINNILDIYLANSKYSSSFGLCSLINNKLKFKNWYNYYTKYNDIDFT